MKDTEANISLLANLFQRMPRLEEKAACAALPIAEVDRLFFGTDDKGEDIRGKARNKNSREAKAICYQCPVRMGCLVHTIVKPGIEVGVWGGKTESERKKLRKIQKGTETPTS